MNAIEVLRTAHMQLTRMQRSDLADLEVMYADPVVMATLGKPGRVGTFHRGGTCPLDVLVG